MKKALFRLDSGGRFGMGHIMRSKALADALQHVDIESTFAAHSIHSESSVYPHQFIRINDEQAFILLAETYDIIIIDHYDYTSQLLLQLSAIKHTTLVVLDDECNRGPLYADMIVNPALSAKALPYDKVAAQATLLIGPQYILLQEIFQDVQVMPFSSRDSIVITFGGSDIAGLTLPVLKELKKSSLNTLAIQVVTGAACPMLDSIAEYCLQAGFKHHHNVDNMAELFSQSRLAISAAGTTAFELASCGTPAVFAVVADNQLLSIQDMCHQGWCAYIDCRSDDNVAALINKAETILTSMPLEKMSSMARSMVDAKGAGRVAEKIRRMVNLSEP